MKTRNSVSISRCMQMVIMFLVLAMMPQTSAALFNKQMIVSGEKEKSKTDENDNLITRETGSHPEYAQDEIIVKFKSSISGIIQKKLDDQLKLSGSRTIGVDPIQRLHARHKVVSVEPVFKSLHKQLKKGKSLEEIVLGVKGRFPNRAKRSLSEADIQGLSRIYKIKVSEGNDIYSIINAYRTDPDVEFVEPNFLLKKQFTPNDPYFSSSASWGQSYDDLWGLKKISIQDAWDVALGAPSTPVVVAVIDTGVDYNHDDLAANIWTNTGETPGNGIDDDGNGFVDDYYGYNFNAGTNNPMDDNGHGTHVSGTIAAVTNNGIGISGIALNTRVMAVKGLNSNGSGYTSDLAEAIYYAVNQGADVQNYSWGGGPGAGSLMLSEAVEFAHSHGCVIVAAAGNSSDDVRYYTPANIKEVITVAATDHNDAISDYSNFGSKIDVSAPGGDGGNAASPNYPEINLLSLRANNTDMYCPGSGICSPLIVGSKYYRSRGTSMAAPHVAGLAALILSKHPEFSNEEVRQVIRLSSDDLGNPGFDNSYGYGRINAYDALRLDSSGIAWISSPASFSFINGVIDIAGTVSAAGFLRYRVEYGAGENPNNFTLLFEGTSPVSNGLLYSWDTTPLSTGNYTVRLTVHDVFGNIFEDRVLLRVDNAVKPGWPFDILNWGTAFFSPSFADINGDGSEEIISATLSKQIYVFNPDGTVMQGWPASVNISYSELNAHYDSPAIGDINNDTKSEIFVNTYNGIYAFDHLGNQLAGWPKATTLNFDAPVVLADINRDGYLEIIGVSKTPYGTSNPGYLYVWDHNGNLLPGFPVNIGVMSSGTNIAVGDIISNINGLEMVVPITNGQTAKINLYDSGGNLVWSCPVNGYVLQLNGSIGDVNSDGLLEIVYRTTLAGMKAGMGVINKDGNLISEWTLSEGRLEYGEPVLGNLDSDSDLEIVASAEANSSGSAYKTIYVWNYDGTSVTGWPIQGTDYTYIPVLADIDGDNRSEVISSFDINRTDGFSTSNKLYAFHSDGSSVSGWPIDFYNWPMSGWQTIINFSRTTIGDIDNDGKLDLAAAPGYGLLYLTELDTPIGTAKLEWPMAFHDVEHTSNYHPIPKVYTDLMMSQLTSQLSSVNVGETLLVTDTVSNTGSLSAGGFAVSYRLSLNSIYGDFDDLLISTTRSISSLAAGSSDTATTSLQIPGTTPSGNYYICAKADESGSISEKDENNNTICTGNTVLISNLDLTMPQMTANVATASIGGSLSVTDTVSNIGDLLAGAFTISYRFSTNSVYGDSDDLLISTTRSISSLAAGSSDTATTSLQILGTTPSGNYYICAKADESGSISEKDENNNTICTGNTVLIGNPDLTMTQIITNATSVSAGKSLSITDTVYNGGALLAPAFINSYRLSKNGVYGDSDDLLISTTRSINSLAGGSSNTVTTSLQIPGMTPSGNYYICAKADGTDSVAETNENNNLICTSNTVKVRGTR